MHNCKLTRNSLTELAMDPLLSQQLLDELRECPACYEEYAAIRDVLRASNQALLSTAPSEDFWPGYHARLVNRIENYSPSAPQTTLSSVSDMWQAMRNVAASSLRVPVPLVATAVVLLLGVSALLIWQTQRQTIVPPGQTAVITQTVEVPIIKEKVVTRVVYVEKNRNRSRSASDQLNAAQAPNAAIGLAQVAPDASAAPSLSLIGFKPTEQVKLKVMKGSYRDEQ